MTKEIHELEEHLRIVTIMHRALEEEPDDSTLMAEQAERLDEQKRSLRQGIRGQWEEHLRESWREGSHTLVEDSRAIMADDSEDEGLRDLIEVVRDFQREMEGAIPLDELATRVGDPTYPLVCLGVVQSKLVMYLSAGTLVVALVD